ncbi:MAG: ATP-dependent DNA helicase [Bacilli bacterium]|nr:ATP-dependent DNA helicase [Bacilli bacterium]
MEKNLTLSVHQLVDFLLRTGDIDNRIYNSATMQEGTLLHAMYQARQGDNYISEYNLAETFDVFDFKVTLEGRADGIIDKGNTAIIDEIKSTVAPLEEYYQEQKEWHLGQAKCYALMYAYEKKYDSVSIRLTYIHQVDKSQIIKTFDYLTSELERDIKHLLEEYIDFFKILFERKVKRNETAGKIEFPFGKFREGQKELAKYSYGIAQNGGTLFAEAPTGIGKTVSTLFPCVKAFANTQNEKIFYLTAKNSGKEMAFNTANLLIEKGLEASAIEILAKDKVCFCPGKACNPDECPYAKGYYTKIRQIIVDSIKNRKTFTTEDISDIATHYSVCPFELSLDLSLYMDIIICDYNYFFDPIVYLKRFFDTDASNMVVLVDEAHNLVERGRDMYSASISSFRFEQVKRSLRHFDYKSYKKAQTRMTKFFGEFKDFRVGDTAIEFFDTTDINAMVNYLLAAANVNKNHHDVVTEEFTDFYLELNKFIKLLEYYDSTFALYVSKKDEDDFRINLYCIDPSKHLRSTMNQVKGRIIFSATLSPTEYYLDVIGGDVDKPLLNLPSPFEKKNMKVLVAPKISVKYKNRKDTATQVADYIKEFVSHKVGNYFVYVPSYEYLEMLVPLLRSEDYELIVQEKDMSEIEKEMFLSCFVEKPESTMLGVAVLGGAFSEGIDLVGERIIGVAIVGVGIPQICFERDLIRNYFDQTEKKGYEYAYVSPGINKVMQALGRVIRSETDRGVALLIDDRYMTKPYQVIFKGMYSNYEVITSIEDIKEQVENFWSNK